LEAGKRELPDYLLRLIIYRAEIEHAIKGESRLSIDDNASSLDT
jgi:hypothetical protein